MQSRSRAEPPQETALGALSNRPSTRCAYWLFLVPYYYSSEISVNPIFCLFWETGYSTTNRNVQANTQARNAGTDADTGFAGAETEAREQFYAAAGNGVPYPD